MIGLPHSEGAAIHRRPPSEVMRATVDLEHAWSHPKVTIVPARRRKPRQRWCAHCAGNHAETECPSRPERPDR